MDDKYWIKKERKRQWYLLGTMLCFVVLILGCLPVSVFAAGIQEGDAGARSTHFHDMSVECGNDAPLNYLPLTGDADGKLYIDGTELTISTGTSFGEGYVLPEGNYYLAEDITMIEALLTEKDKMVNICLNGNTLQVDDGFYIEENGTLCISDCGSGGRIISDYTVLQAADNGHFIMYGGCLENTNEEKDGQIYEVILMLNPFIKVEIYGGTIKSNGGIGISGNSEEVEVLQLSGRPEFLGNQIDVNSDVILHLKDLNTDISKKIKVACKALLPSGESKQIDSISALDHVDYSSILASEIKNQYFTYKEGHYYVNMAGIMKQPTQEQVCVNAYPVEGADYQWYEAEEQNVTADRMTHVSGMTVFTLQAGDTFYLTLPDMPDSDTVFLLVGAQTSEMIYMSPLGEGRYKGIVETEDMFVVIFVGEEGEGLLEVEDEAYKVVRITQGDAVSGQTINTLTKAAAGTYMCEVTWENLGCCVNSELVEFTEAVDAGWTLDADGKLTIASDDGMRNWIENRDACKELVRTAEILEDVTDIKDSAFYGCSSLTRVAMLGEIPPGLSGSEVFTGCSFVTENTKGIFVPVGKADAYKNAWEDYADYITDGCPEIVTQPTNQSVKNGEQATFSVTAEGVLQPLTYQWQVNKNGTEERGFSNIANANSDTYTITVDKNCNGYWYRCVVTNERGSVTSSALELTVTDSDADKIAAAKEVVEEVLAGYTATNDSTSEDIQNKINTALTNAGISDVTVTVGDLTIKKATREEEGSISGSIAIQCGIETGSVTVNKTIAKLLISDADKVAAAKAVVEKALEGIVATNETTKEDIQNKINTALSSGGITDVTVMVGELTVKKATNSEEGSISGSIAIQCGIETDGVTVNKPIAKLPTSDEDKPEVPESPEVPEVPEVPEPPEKPGNTVPSAVSQKEQEKNALFLNAKLKVSQTDKKINIAWGKVSGADGYDVYVQYCGKKFTDKSITAVKSGKTTKVTVKKVNGKSLDLKKNYKIYVLAYKLVDDKKVTLGKTVAAHIVGRKNTKYTNVKAVKVKKRSYSLKKGETVKIQASTVLVTKSKKQLTDAHAKEFRYATSDKKVATVSKQGKIKAVGKGTCTIYVYARNGYAKQITVKVQ